MDYKDFDEVLKEWYPWIIAGALIGWGIGMFIPLP